MNQLYYGDNLQVLLEHIAKESVDLIYLDGHFVFYFCGSVFAHFQFAPPITLLRLTARARRLQKQAASA